jgi:hypothetical protein
VFYVLPLGIGALILRRQIKRLIELLDRPHAECIKVRLSRSGKLLCVGLYLVRPASTAHHTEQVNCHVARDVDHLTFGPLALAVLV